MFHNFTKKCKLVDKTQRVWDQKLTKAKFEKSIICIFKFLRVKTRTKNLSIGHLTHSKANYVKISRPTPLIFRRFGGYTRYLRWLNREFQMYFISEKNFLPSFNLYLSLTGIFKSVSSLHDGGIWVGTFKRKCAALEAGKESVYTQLCPSLQGTYPGYVATSHLVVLARWLPGLD